MVSATRMEPYQFVANNERFQAACQRYAHGNGSSYAIAQAALAAIEHDLVVKALQAAEQFSRAAIAHGDNVALQRNPHNCRTYLEQVRSALKAAGAEPLP